MLSHLRQSHIAIVAIATKFGGCPPDLLKKPLRLDHGSHIDRGNMDGIKDEKIDKHTDEIEVESEEKIGGEQIEVDEERLLTRDGYP
jgi:hypothetical protein